MKTVCKTSLSPKKRKGLHTRKTNIQENNLITKQTFHQTAFSMKTFYKTSLSPKNILHENGLQNKPFTKEHSPRKWSTKQTVHHKNKKKVYKTSLSPKSILHENGLPNKPFTKEHAPRKRSAKQACHQKKEKVYTQVKQISKKTI